MFLHDFKNDTSRKSTPQETALDWLSEQHSWRSGIAQEKLLKMLERFGCGPSQIKQRRTWLPEFNGQETLFVKPAKTEQPDIEQRMRVFKEQIKPSVDLLYKNHKQGPSHLLHVSCTGYFSPSVAQELVLEKKWPCLVQHIYHMGCYAAIPAVRTAQGILATEKSASVEILHTEFCTLHVNLEVTTPEQLVVQSLFADACIRYQVSQQKPVGPCLEVLATHEALIPDSALDMSWQLSKIGLAMTLSREVPEKIGQHLKAFIDVLFKKAQVDISELSRMTAAIHPGGPKIIESIRQLLELREDQVRLSRKILFENGNMSSATVPFIWKEFLQSDEELQSPYVLSLAFGPGLTIAGSLLCLRK